MKMHWWNFRMNSTENVTGTTNLDRKKNVSIYLDWRISIKFHKNKILFWCTKNHVHGHPMTMIRKVDSRSHIKPRQLVFWSLSVEWYVTLSYAYAYPANTVSTKLMLTTSYWQCGLRWRCSRFDVINSYLDRCWTEYMNGRRSMETTAKCATPKRKRKNNDLFLITFIVFRFVFMFSLVFLH